MLEDYKNKLIQKIIDFEENKISIDDLVDCVVKNEPLLIYKLLDKKETEKLGHVADLLQEYNFYKNQGEEKVILDEVDWYYLNFLKGK